MEPSLEVYQFLIAKKQAGLILFGFVQDLQRWNAAHTRYLMNNGCYYIPQMQTWRFEGTLVRLATLEDEKDLMKLRGYTFDRSWFVNVDASLARLAVGVLRLPLNNTANNRKVLTDGNS